MITKLLLAFVVVHFCLQSQAYVTKSVEDWSVQLNSEHAYVSGINGMYSLGRLMGFVLSNVFYLNEDSKVKWLAYEDWNFTSTIDASDILSYENVNLVLDGVDTFAEVSFNNNTIAITENMFRQYVLDIKKYVAEKNILRINISSPLNYAQKKSTEYTYVIPPECPDPAYKGDCHVNKIRKMQSSFSWDWGPSMPSMGIWKPVYLEAYNETVIRHVVVDTEKVGKNWQVNVDVYFQNNKRNVVAGTLRLDAEVNTVIGRTVKLAPNAYGEIVYTTSFLVPESKVQLWWPNGYGSQKLYKLTASFTSDRKEITSKQTTFGFRTVELVQERMGTNGLSFYFKVNGLPIFAKGSNLIPIDLRPEIGQDETAVRKLFSAAAASHMNMLRVWGGGVYESDFLYDLADEYGILIWQDFMFACALYPTDDAFLDNVVQEVRYQVKRLRSHPSIVLFSGNNENEGALVDNWWGISDKSRYEEDYVKLYVSTIKKEFERLTHGRGIYVTSSPSNGQQSENEGYLSKQPGSSYYGDVHFYDYNGDSFEPSTYPIPRFCSEYGFQSLPSADSFLRDTHTQSDLSLTSDFMNYRQHHPLGNAQLLDLINKQLTLPNVKSTNYNLGIIYYSQIVQAYSYKIQTERYRNYRSILTSDGRGKTMGALYWQLNDVWTAPTWSSIDYYGRWKMAQYFAVNFFSPVIISGHIEQSNILNIYVVSDHEKVEGTAYVRIYNWDSTNPITTYEVKYEVDAGSSKLIRNYNDLEAVLQGVGCTSTTCFITLSTEKAPDNIVFPAKLKNSAIKAANVQILDVTKNGTAFDIRMFADLNAFFVWLDAHSIPGRFSDNGFFMLGGKRIIQFYPEQSDISLEEVKAALTVTHLKDDKYFE